jgi:hypothetical protein
MEISLLRELIEAVARIVVLLNEELIQDLIAQTRPIIRVRLIDTQEDEKARINHPFLKNAGS